jgi:hypothetical protein
MWSLAQPARVPCGITRRESMQQKITLVPFVQLKGHGKY